MNTTVGRTVHRGSRSIDFISHNVKSSITQPKVIDLEGVQLKMNEISKFKVHDKPIHPFYRPSNLKKLIKTLRPKVASEGGIPAILEATADQTAKVKFNPKFGSSREVMALLKKIPDGFNTLTVVDLPEYTESPIDQELSDRVNEMLKEQTPDEIMDIPLKTKEGFIIMKEEKLKTIMKSQSIKDQTDLLNKFIVKEESEIFASSITKAFLYKMRNTLTSYRSRNQFTERLLSIEETLKKTYPNTKTNLDINLSFLATYLHVKCTSRTQSLIYELATEGYTPNSTLIEQYLTLLHKSLSSKSLTREQYLENIFDFDDIFHAVVNDNMICLLMKASTTLEEANVLLSKLQSRHQGEEVSKAFEKNGDSLANIITEIPKQKHVQDVNVALKTTMTQKFQKVCEFSYESKLKLLQDSVQSGNLIFASKLLTNIQLKKRTIKLLKNDLSLRSFQFKNNRPGFDLRSKNAFMKQLEQLLKNCI